MIAGDTTKNRFSTVISKSLLEMKIGEIKHLKVPARLTFGERLEEKVFKMRLLKNHGHNVGDEVQIKVATGNIEEVLDGIIININGDYADVDTNHPLAGQNLNVKIEIISFD